MNKRPPKILQKYPKNCKIIIDFCKKKKKKSEFYCLRYRIPSDLFQYFDACAECLSTENRGWCD